MTLLRKVSHAVHIGLHIQAAAQCVGFQVGAAQHGVGSDAAGAVQTEFRVLRILYLAQVHIALLRQVYIAAGFQVGFSAHLGIQGVVLFTDAASRVQGQVAAGLHRGRRISGVFQGLICIRLGLLGLIQKFLGFLGRRVRQSTLIFRIFPGLVCHGLVGIPEFAQVFQLILKVRNIGLRVCCQGILEFLLGFIQFLLGLCRQGLFLSRSLFQSGGVLIP